MDGTRKYAWSSGSPARETRIVFCARAFLPQPLLLSPTQAVYPATGPTVAPPPQAPAAGGRGRRGGGRGGRRTAAGGGGVGNGVGPDRVAQAADAEGE